MRMYDDYFSYYTWKAGGSDGIQLDVEATAKYVGN
jgi:hypothetical protein